MRHGAPITETEFQSALRSGERSDTWLDVQARALWQFQSALRSGERSDKKRLGNRDLFVVSIRAPLG